MNALTTGQPVRLPRQLGYAEGTLTAHSNGGYEDAWYVLIRGTDIMIKIPAQYLTAIEDFSIGDGAPQLNVTTEGHPMVEHHETEVSLVVDYIRSVERGETSKVCWCPWTPLAKEGRMGRLRTGEHPQCPAHTKEGYLFGFIAHVRATFAEQARHAKNVQAIAAAFEIPESLLKRGALIEEFTTEEGKASVRWVE